jgi:hypothetical protein
MGEHKLPRQPIPVTTPTDEVTFKSCCTEVFRWVRKSIEIAEKTPEFIKSCAEDVAEAWDDSAKQ